MSNDVLNLKHLLGRLLIGTSASISLYSVNRFFRLELSSQMQLY